jgi:hypothetical protein
MAKDNINVVVDGVRMNFTTSPELVNGRTMVPMREIFEYLGAEVNWWNSSNMIDVRFGERKALMIIGIKQITFNWGNRYLNLDVPPIRKNGVTLVPIRTVSEVFSANVSWDGNSNTAYISTRYPKINNQTVFDSKHIRTSYGNNEYVDFSINNNILTVKGKILDNKISKLMVDYIDKKNYKSDIHNGFRKILDITKNKEFSLEINLNKYMTDTESTVNIWKLNKNSEKYEEYLVFKVKIEKRNNDYSIQKPSEYDRNKSLTSQWLNPIGYEKRMSNSEVTLINPELINLSNEICSGVESDYEKVRKIHDWVAENIYYDYDYINDKKNNITYKDSFDVYKNKRAVCAGFSNLMRDLIQVQNIPCRKIHGFEIYTYKEVWTDEIREFDKVNHAWVQAYVDNRWINIDVTWDSNNRYENGKYIKKGSNGYTYFDISDEMLSYSHRSVLIELD